ncbi:plasmid mobilization protein [Streptomyces sp. NPDC001118]
MPRPPRQTRRPRQSGGRPHQCKIRLSDEEMLKVEARAISLGINAQRLFIESVLNDFDNELRGIGWTISERHQVYRELAALRRLIAQLGNNVNQLARIANSTGYLERETAGAMAATTRVMGRADEVLATLMPPPDRSTTEAEDASEGDYG